MVFADAPWPNKRETWAEEIWLLGGWEIIIERASKVTCGFYGLRRICQVGVQMVVHGEISAGCLEVDEGPGSEIVEGDQMDPS
jgi:hypothetical protein